MDLGKRNLMGVLVDALDYDGAVDRVMDAVRLRRPFAGTALAVHGLMTGVDDKEHRYRLNELDLAAPDGQPVRWALNLAHGVGLRERVYGPKLMLKLCERAAADGLPIFLYGSSRDTVDRLSANLTARFPGLTVAGAEPSRFRTLTPEEKLDTIGRIRATGARLVFVGLGCPRQEIFAYEFRDSLRIPILAVGAAFDYHAGLLSEPPEIVQRLGLQWLYRLLQDPRRLWRRYVLLNPRFVLRLARQLLGAHRLDSFEAIAPSTEVAPG